MHRTLDDSVAALVGRLPSIAPVIEAEEKAVAPTATGLIPEALQILRRELQEAIDKLQQALERLKRIEPQTGPPSS